MFDQFRNQYSLRCPSLQENVWVSVSKFRRIRRLRGASAPAVFRVEFECECSNIHETLVSHDNLDWAPLGTESASTFMNLVTCRRELVASELANVASDQIRRGRWPWTFWCHPEHSMRPGFPSSLRLVTDEHDHGSGQIGVLVRCFSCSRHTINIVSRDHLDVPWHSDARIGFVAQLFDGDQLSPEERFRHQLWDGPTKLTG